MPSWRGSLAAGLLAAGQLAAAAYTLDLGSTDSLKAVAKSMAEDLMSFYMGHQPGGVPGLLPKPYYWWEAGALMGALVDYWYYTGDARWNDVTQEGLLFQVGPNKDYMPPNQTMTEGNDDQGFWGMAVMSAAESNFPNPPPDKPQWLALAQAVFNTQAARWEEQDCGGGLRWQIFRWNNGYNYKNSISQGCFFNIAARLARYTGNQTYAEWAERTWDWMVATRLLNLETYFVYDGINTENCSHITPYQWSYNAGAFLLGAAAMYSYSAGTEKAHIWRERVDGLLNGTDIFFAGDQRNIMTEVACERVNLCDVDQQSFKAYLSRWMAATTKWAPWTYGRVKPLFEASAAAAASTCAGGRNGRMCGLKWTEHGKWDGSTGVGQQMAAMQIVLANMIQHARAPVTDNNGGTSTGNPGAGVVDAGRTNRAFLPISPAEKAGAYILTSLAVLGLILGSVFVLMEERYTPLPERLLKLRSAMVAAGSHGRSPSLLTLQPHSSSRSMEKRTENSSGTLLDAPDTRNGMIVNSCVRTTRITPTAILRPLPSVGLGSGQWVSSREPSYRKGGNMEAPDGGDQSQQRSYAIWSEGRRSALRAEAERNGRTESGNQMRFIADWEWE